MKDQLKFITCGSVDDGKSTLIGHLLYDAKLLFADQAHALELDSNVGSREGEIDYSLLLDGLMAEREQGITIDVAYRFFTTEKRSFIVADCPGHEQYTRNMAVGASFADLAVILVDAARGISVQTKRHTRISALMGIRHFVLAVNKMDLVSYDSHVFEEIKKEFKRYAAEFRTDSIQVIPVSATAGDNVVEKSSHTGWYAGPSLLSYLEQVEMVPRNENSGFLMPVQCVNRPNHSFRGFSGQVESGNVSVGNTLIALPGGESAGVKQILVGDKETQNAQTGQAVTLQLDREIDISRGSVLTRDTIPELTDMFTAQLLWMDDAPLVAGRAYLLKCGTRTLPANVASIKYKVDINDGRNLPAKRLLKNELAFCDISLAQDMVFTSFEENRALGGFILIDKVSHATSAVGVIQHSLRRSTNVHWQKTDLTRQSRATAMGQTPRTFWFTGLSGSGKSALANALEVQLARRGLHTLLLDGDNVRHGLCRDLGFTEADRVENIRRVAEVSRLMNDAGIIVLTAFISPYEKDRQNAKEILGDAFVEIYISTPLEECERRDVKGLYRKARQGDIPEFTGVSSPYEAPQSPAVQMDTTGREIEFCVDELLLRLERFL